MKRIEFSETTYRLHRNVVAIAAAIIGIKIFDLQIDKAGTLGLEIKNFTTGVLVMILLTVLIYNAIAYAIRALEEYRAWQLETERQAAAYGGGIGIINLSNKISELSVRLEKHTKESGPIRIHGEDVFTKEDADAFKLITKEVQTYAERLHRFPIVTRLRFWGWDIAFTTILTLAAVLFAVSLLPSARMLLCSSA